MKPTLGCFSILCFFLIGSLAIAEDVPDTEGNRLKAARRYIEAVPLTAMYEDMISRLAKEIPEKNRQSFVELMKKEINVLALESMAMVIIANHYNVQEITAMADFYGSELGRSITQKSGACMAQLILAIEQQTNLALQRLASKTPKKP